jgi:O-antigen/teichoic acid export membrane protein
MRSLYLILIKRTRDEPETFSRRFRLYCNGKWLFALADQGVCSAANFLAGAIIGRSCAPEQFGLYLLAFTVLLLCTDIQAALIWTPYTTTVPLLSSHDRRPYTAAVLVHQLSFGFAVCLLLGSLVTVGLAFHHSSPYSSISRLLLLAAPVLLCREAARRVCFALLRFRTAFVTDVVISAAQIVSLIFLARHGFISPASAFGAGTAAAVAGLMLWVWLMRAEVLSRPGGMLKHFVHNCSTGGWVFLSGVVWTLLSNAYPWILSATLGTESAATWGVCIAVTASCNPLLLGLQNFMAPRVAHAYAEGGLPLLQRKSVRYSILFCAALVPIAVILLAAGGTIVRRVYGAAYAGHGSIVAIMALNLFALAAGFAPSRALFCLGKARSDALVNVGALFCTASVSVALINLGGVIGAAVGLLLVNTGSSAVRHWLVQRAAVEVARDARCLACCDAPAEVG